MRTTKTIPVPLSPSEVERLDALKEEGLPPVAALRPRLRLVWQQRRNRRPCGRAGGR